MDVLDLDTVDRTLIDTKSQWVRDGSELVKRWKGKDFAAALAYVNEVGRLAEEANHHPDIDIRWNQVTLHLSTHSAGGITSADLDMARRIDSIEPSQG